VVPLQDLLNIMDIKCGKAVCTVYLQAMNDAANDACDSDDQQSAHAAPEAANVDSMATLRWMFLQVLADHEHAVAMGIPRIICEAFCSSLTKTRAERDCAISAVCSILTKHDHDSRTADAQTMHAVACGYFPIVFELLDVLTQPDDRVLTIADVNIELLISTLYVCKAMPRAAATAWFSNETLYRLKMLLQILELTNVLLEPTASRNPCSLFFEAQMITLDTIDAMISGIEGHLKWRMLADVIAGVYECFVPIFTSQTMSATVCVHGLRILENLLNNPISVELGFEQLTAGDRFEELVFCILDLCAAEEGTVDDITSHACSCLYLVASLSLEISFTCFARVRSASIKCLARLCKTLPNDAILRQSLSGVLGMAQRDAASNPGGQRCGQIQELCEVMSRILTGYSQQFPFFTPTMSERAAL
jgi:hypothetical protein